MSDAALSLSLLEDEAPTPGHRGFETAREVRRLEAELVSVEQRRDRARRHLEAEDPDSPAGQATLQLARDLADDLLRNGRDQLRLAHRAAEQAAAARVAVAVREAHDRLAEARADIARAVEERAAFAETVANLSPGEIAELVQAAPLGAPTRPIENEVSPEPAPGDDESARRPRHGVHGDEVSGRGVGVVGSTVDPAAAEGSSTLVGSLPASAVAQLAGVSGHAARRGPVAHPDASDPSPGTLAAASGSPAGCGEIDRPLTTLGTDLGSAVARDADEFWDEQESTRSRAWVRPLEIVLPMVAAAVLVVLLLLVLG